MKIRECPECGGKLDFSLFNRTPSDVQDGRLRSNEVSPMACLGCTECSETIRIYHEHEIVAMLNEWLHGEIV